MLEMLFLPISASSRHSVRFSKTSIGAVCVSVATSSEVQLLRRAYGRVCGLPGGAGRGEISCTRSLAQLQQKRSSSSSGSQKHYCTHFTSLW